MCKARLGLARVSVVRGEGAAAGSPAIDDYIRSLEPISDYLTKWSGLVSCSPPPITSRLGSLFQLFRAQPVPAPLLFCESV